MDIKLEDVWLMQGDCLERMKEIPSGSVDMILTDPPYGTVKGVGDGDVSHGMKNKTEWDVCLNTKQMMYQCHRILRDRGVLALFAQGNYMLELSNNNHGNLPLDYRMIWFKDHFANSLIAKKAPVNLFEDICIYSKRDEDLKGHPLQKWFNEELNNSEYNVKDLILLSGNEGFRHHFTNGKIFRVPSEERYTQLGLITGLFNRPYSEIKCTDEEYKKGLKKHYKTFNLPEGKKYKSNVLSYKKDYSGFHPTQKPVALLEDLIKTYTNECDTVLDFTMGSGSTGVACRNTNRKFIGIEMDVNYYCIATERVLMY